MDLPANRHTVLIVDDESVICELLSRLFEAHDCTVFTAKDGNAGLRICRTRSVDLVITDLSMPDKDGFELVRTLRSEFPAIKIIAMSGMLRSEGFLKAALAFGAHDTLAKPFTLISVWSSAEALLRPAPCLVGSLP
jgi:DNA-binding response OmpR family regulator